MPVIGQTCLLKALQRLLCNLHREWCSRIMGMLDL
jgi:hypothetical protein